MNDRDSLTERIAATLQDALTRAGKSNSQLAREIGVSRQASYGWLKGRSVPRPESREALERALKVDLSFIDDAVESRTRVFNNAETLFSDCRGYLERAGERITPRGKEESALDWHLRLSEALGYERVAREWFRKNGASTPAPDSLHAVIAGSGLRPAIAADLTSGQRIAAIRYLSGMTLEALAQTLSLQLKAVWEIEKDTPNPHTETVEAWAEERFAALVAQYPEEDTPA